MSVDTTAFDADLSEMESDWPEVCQYAGHEYPCLFNDLTLSKKAEEGGFDFQHSGEITIRQSVILPVIPEATKRIEINGRSFRIQRVLLSGDKVSFVLILTNI